MLRSKNKAVVTKSLIFRKSRNSRRRQRRSEDLRRKKVRVKRRKKRENLLRLRKKSVSQSGARAQERRDLAMMESRVA